ncbi:hypothetical protein CPB85DRAFT_1257717 [Mucidula mucida]|nr:hypothetical protein CPB85DRAFT_1257717 [Mucidula mucida]
MPPPLLRLDANRRERTLDVKLVLTRPLRDEKLARPHTWLADMVAVDDQDSKPSVGRVVLKIAQQSRMVIPDTSDRNRNISRLRVWHHITLVAHDFLMFEKLEHLQGGIIPYSYGLHQIKMPNDEDAYVFITEYIEGRTLGA